MCVPYPRCLVNLALLLTESDATRATRTLVHLARHCRSIPTLTGGVAIELQILARSAQSVNRPLHDLDFLVGFFDEIPFSLCDDFLVRHVHPYDPPGKTLLQAVDRGTSLRVDIFRAYGQTLARTHPLTIAGIPIRLVSIEDLIARHARLCCDILEDKPVAPKFARDFLRLLEVVAAGWAKDSFPTLAALDPIWQEHRKASHPATFPVAVSSLRHAIRARTDLLIPPVYSTDIHEDCPRCCPAPGFTLSPGAEILTRLGYC